MNIFSNSLENRYIQNVRNIYMNGSTVNVNNLEMIEKLNVFNKDIQFNLGSGYIDGLYLDDLLEMKLLNKNIYWDGYKLVDYVKQWLVEETAGFSYTYGERLNEPFIHDDSEDESFFKSFYSQTEIMMNRLISDLYSRRAVATIYNPIKDSHMDNIPCLNYLQIQLRNNKLHTTAVWRSHDVYGAWFPNMIGLMVYMTAFRDKLLEYDTIDTHNGKVVKDIQMGTINVLSNNMHIYKTDLDNVEKLIGVKND